MDISKEELDEYASLFMERFGLKFIYGYWWKTYIITIYKTGNHNYPVGAHAESHDSFRECIRRVKNQICTAGLFPESEDPCVVPWFNSPAELKMKLELRGK